MNYVDFKTNGATIKIKKKKCVSIIYLLSLASSIKVLKRLEFFWLSDCDVSELFIKPYVFCSVAGESEIVRSVKCERIGL